MSARSKCNSGDFGATECATVLRYGNSVESAETTSARYNGALCVGRMTFFVHIAELITLGSIGEWPMAEVETALHKCRYLLYVNFL